MRWSLYLGKVSGIRIYIHWTFWILIVWIFFMYYNAGQSIASGLTGVLFIFALFGCVVLHELGHALTAQRFHIVTRNITLLPIGGMANMERLPEKPGQELLVAIMGPAVNVVIAFILYFALSASGAIPTVDDLRAMQEAGHSLMSGGYFLFNLMAVNVVLVLFNLIPAFPMDGGRVLRALLSYRLNRSKATLIAARIGQLLAIGFVFAGFFTNFWLVFIGVFIFLGAGGEASYEATKHLLRGFTVGDVVMTNYTPLSPGDTLAHAVRALLDGSEQEFLVCEGDRAVGVLTRKNIIKGVSEFGKEALVSGSMQTDFITLSPEMELKEVFHQMAANGVAVAPVYRGQELIGIVNRENINELVMVAGASKESKT